MCRVTVIKIDVKMDRSKSDGNQLDFDIQLYNDKGMSIRKICENTGVNKVTLFRNLNIYFGRITNVSTI